MESSRKESKARRTKARDARPTIGFLAGNVWSVEIAYPNIVWNGVADAAREHEVNLLTFPGEEVREKPASPAARRQRRPGPKSTGKVFDDGNLPRIPKDDVHRRGEGRGNRELESYSKISACFACIKYSIVYSM